MWQAIKAKLLWVWQHRTKAIGIIGVGAGFAQNHLADIGIVIPDHWHGVVVASLGIIVFCIGLFNSMNR